VTTRADGYVAVRRLRRQLASGEFGGRARGLLSGVDQRSGYCIRGEHSSCPCDGASCVCGCHRGEDV
jgi:hypothetical protein